jgi:hypothetical protein
VAVSAQRQPWYGAWTTFKSGRLAAALVKTPSVYAGGSVTPIEVYSQLDSDGSATRNLGIGYVVNGDAQDAVKARQFLLAWAAGNKPVPYRSTGDYIGYQGGYHQSYGYFSFALGYDLTKSSTVYTSADHAAIKAWFVSIANALRTYQDFWVTQVRTGRMAYSWQTTSGVTLTEAGRDYDVGRDTSSCTAAAWLAAAIVSGYQAHLDYLYNPAYVLSIPAIMHYSSAPDNDGDGRATRPVPQVQVNAGLSRAGNLAYMSYNARVAAMLYQMTKNLGRATTAQADELHTSFLYLSKFSGPNPEPPICPGDTTPWGDQLARMQMAVHLFGDAVFVADVNGGQASPASLYDIQYLGPMLLIQPGL